MRRSHAVAAVVVGVVCATPAPLLAADETAIALAAGAGRDQVQAACSICHSLDYIVMNSPFQDKTGWEKTVNKMVTVFGAPLTPDEAAAIVAYLERHYGKSAGKP